MLLYGHQRTDKIVERLCIAEGITRLITIGSSVVYFTVAGMPFGGLMIGGIIGAGIGLVIGNLSILIISAVIEWMCQLLIAHGELVANLKRKPNE